MNDDGVIELLRAAGNGTGGATDLGPAMRAGNKIRRRRRIAQAAGGGAGLAAVVALGVLVAGTGGQTVVVGPAGGGPEPTAPPVSGTDAERAKTEADAAPARLSYNANTKLMLARLGPGFREGRTGEQGQVVLDENGPLAKQLPDGYRGAARLTVFQDSDSGGSVSFGKQCAGWEEKDTRIGPCKDTKLSDGTTVGVQDYRTIPSERKNGAWDGTFASYRRDEYSWVRVEFYAFDTREAKTAPADQQAAIDWLGQWTDKLATLAADPEVAPESSNEVPPAKPSTARQANLALLLKHLGPDWQASKGDEGEVAVPVPGSATAKQLPEDFRASAFLTVWRPESLTMDEKCKPMVEKGLHVERCKPLQLADGRTAQVQKSYVAPGEYNPPPPRHGLTASHDSLSVMLDRIDDSYVEVRLKVEDTRTVTPKSDLAVGANWLKNWTDELATVAADPAVAPKAVTETGPEAPIGPTRHEVYQGYLQEALGSSFSLVDGKVVLEPGSQKHSELPFTASDVTGELEFIAKSQFDAACQAKPGLEPCESTKLADGRTVHWRSWADRDSSDNTMRGEFAVYLPREDGSVIMANLTLRACR